MASNTRGGKHLHDRLLASGAQPLVGLVSSSDHASPLEDNGNQIRLDDQPQDDRDLQTYSVSWTRTKQESCTSSRRSILKNSSTSGSSEATSSNKLPSSDNSTTPLIKRVPIVSADDTFQATPYHHHHHRHHQQQQQQQQQQHKERAILIEKYFPDIETATPTPTTRTSALPRSSSRISWNLDESDKDSSQDQNNNSNNNSDHQGKPLEDEMSYPRPDTQPQVRYPSTGYRDQRWAPPTQAVYRDDLQQQQQQARYNQNGSGKLSMFEPEQEPDPEPVYVCRCCGLAWELAPSMRYLPRFKMAFFVFNSLVFLFGVALFGMGLWFRIDPKVYELHKYIETQNFTIAGWIMLFAGFTVCLVALIGFNGANKQRPGYLVFYFVMVAIITLLFMGALVLVTVYGLGQSLERFATKEVFQQIQQKPFSDRAAQFLDFLQVKLKCCGATSFTDYARLGMNPPISCNAIDRNFINAPGCGQAFRELFDIRAGMAAGFCTGAIFVQLVAISMAAIMFCVIYHARIPADNASNISQGINTARHHVSS